MKIRDLRTVAYIGALYCVATKPANACDCSPPALDVGFESHDTVFHGVLIAEEPDFPSPAAERPLRWLRFSVLRSFKGEDCAELTVWTEPGGSFAGCGLWGRIGDGMVVFASDSDDGSRHVVGFCAAYPEPTDLELPQLEELAAARSGDPAPCDPEPADPDSPSAGGSDEQDIDDQPMGACGLGISLPLLLASSLIPIRRMKCAQS